MYHYDDSRKRASFATTKEDIENDIDESYSQDERGVFSSRKGAGVTEVSVLWRQLKPSRGMERLAGEHSFKQVKDTVTLNDVQNNNRHRNEFGNVIGQSLLYKAKEPDKNRASIISQRTNFAVTTPVLAETFAGEDFYLSAKQSLQDVMKSSLQQMALDILLETGLKLTGIDKSATETFVPIIKLIQEARTALLSGSGNLTNRIKRLSEALNTARNSLSNTRSDSVIIRGTDILCDVADVLHKGLSTSDLSKLKAPVEKLAMMPELSFVQGMIPLIELGEQLQQWNNDSVTGQDLVRALVEKVVPEGLVLPLKVGEKIARGIQSGNLHVGGLPAWPGSADKVACLQWLRVAMTNNSLRETIAKADRQWLTNTLEFNTEEAEYAYTTLLPYAQTLASFLAQDTPEEWLIALKTIPGLAEIVSRADLSLNDNLGAIGSLLQDNTTLSKLGRVVTASGTNGKVWEALKLFDTEKALVTLKNLSFEVLKKTVHVHLDAASAAWLVLKKGKAFLQSAYSVGQSLSDPVRLYRDVILFIKEDVKEFPDDYKNATIETLLATVALVFRSFGGNHVPINWGGNTAEWLKAYAEADPEKLTVVDHVLMHAVLEPRAALEIKQAIQQEDTIQARKLLEPFRDALKSYAGDSPVLRQIADALPYIPAMSEAWKEIRALDLRERKELHIKLSQQAVLLDDIAQNSLQNVSHETQIARQQSILALQKELVVLQNKCDVGSGQMNMLQAELDAMKVALKTLPNESQTRLRDELDLAQTSLDNLKKPDQLKALPMEDVKQIYSRQTDLDQSVRNSLIAEGVSPVTIMQIQLKEMMKVLDALSIDVKLTDIGSLVHFAAEALTRLATSTKPSLVSARAQLATLVRKSASDSLTDVVRWSGKQMMKLFTKEVELTPEEKDIGLFVIERELSAGQLVTGATAGAASGALLSAVFLLLSGDLKGSKEQPVKGTINRKTPESATGPVMINAESGQEKLSPSQAEIYKTTTELLTPESHGLKTWLMLALPVVAGALAGAGIAAAMKPAIREKYGAEGMTAINDPNRASKSDERLYRHTDADGVTKGIFLTDDMIEMVKIRSAYPVELLKEGTFPVLERSPRSLSMNTRSDIRKLKKKEQQRANSVPTRWTNDTSSEIVDLNLYEFNKRTGGYEDRLYPSPGQVATENNLKKYILNVDDSPDVILTRYLKNIYQGFGKGLRYDDDVHPNDISVKYSVGGNEIIVTPKQMVTNQVDALLQKQNDPLVNGAAKLNSAKKYTFPSRYPSALQDKLKAGDFWDTIKNELKAMFTDSEKVKSQKEEIRLRCQLAIMMDNGVQDVDRVLERAKPVLYKSRIVTGMFMVPDQHAPTKKGRIYCMYNSFKPLDVEYDTDVAPLLSSNKNLADAIKRGFTGIGVERENILTTDNKISNMNPNKIAKFYSWEGGSSGGLENLIFSHMRDKLYQALDSISTSDWESIILKALEIVRVGANILSLIPVPYISAAFGTIGAAASLILSRVSEDDEVSREYATEAFWMLALSIIDIGSLGSGKTLRDLGSDKLKGITYGLDDSLDRLKALKNIKDNKEGVTESLSSFKRYFSNLKEGKVIFNEFTNQAGESYKKGRVVAEGAAGKIFDIGDGFLVKEYKRPILVRGAPARNDPHRPLPAIHASSLAEANNNVTAFNRIYGSGSAKLNISSGVDEFTKIVTVKMKKIKGESLHKLARSSDPAKDAAIDALSSEAKINSVVEEGLRKLRTEGVIHDDINQGSILFDAESGKFKLIGFDRVRLNERGQDGLVVPLDENQVISMRNKFKSDLKQFKRDVITPDSQANIERIFGPDATWSYNNYIAQLKAHGAFGGGNVNHMTGTQTAEAIEKLLGHNNEVKQLELFSCFGGMGGFASNAQVIANKLNIPVTSYKWTVSGANKKGVVKRTPRKGRGKNVKMANDKIWNDRLYSISEIILRVRAHMREPGAFALSANEQIIHNSIRNLNINLPDDEWVSRGIRKVIADPNTKKIFHNIDEIRPLIIYLEKGTVYVVDNDNRVSFNDIIESYKDQFGGGDDVNVKFNDENKSLSMENKNDLLSEGKRVKIPS